MKTKEEVDRLLRQFYNGAMKKASGSEEPIFDIVQETALRLKEIVKHAESSKAVLTVVFTSLFYKIINPDQDIRRHQAGLPGGYSGRTFDKQYITPFLRKYKFPAMAESGWLTRSLEQKTPYDFNYNGAIKPAELKEAFLGLMNDIEEKNVDPEKMLDCLLQLLIIQRDKFNIAIAKPQNLMISEIINLLNRHFYYKEYKAPGASRLPVLALYAIYLCLFDSGFDRYNKKQLLPLESHNSADKRSGRLGDIDILDEQGNAFESVEVKFDIPITHNIISIVKEKIQPSTVKRFYVLSTQPELSDDQVEIEKDINQIKNTHGCQLVVNGVLPTIKYYLRLLSDTSAFVKHYADLMEKDNSITFEHRQEWNDLVSNL